MRKVSGSGTGLQKPASTGTSNVEKAKSEDKPKLSDSSSKVEEKPQQPAKPLDAEQKAKRASSKQLSGVMSKAKIQEGLEKEGKVPSNWKPARKPSSETVFTNVKNQPGAPQSPQLGVPAQGGQPQPAAPQPNVSPQRKLSDTVYNNLPTQLGVPAQAQANAPAPNPQPAAVQMRARGMAHGEKSLPEVSLDSRKQVAQSRIEDRLTPESLGNVQLGKANQKVADNYFGLSHKPMATTAEGKRAQFATLDSNLNKLTSDKQVGAHFKNEQRLLDDTVRDPSIMNSAHVSSPAHAMELKRLGLQPSVAGRVGQFTDVRLDGDMKKLGSGNLNTVYIGKYTLPDSKFSYEGVFKPEVKKWDNVPIAGEYSGIDPKSPRAGYRNVATTRLDEALNFRDQAQQPKFLTTRSEMAVHNNTLGTVSEKAPGKAPKGSSMLSNQKVPDQFAKDMADPQKGYGKNWVQEYNATRGEGKEIGEKVVNGKTEYYYKGNTMRDINYNDPHLRRDLVRLQLMDSISGQVDRHNGNYFVQQDRSGRALSVKGIDNDLSWGKDLKQVENITSGKLTRPEDAIHLPKYLPPVVDREAHRSIMALTPQTFQQKMGGLLTNEEMSAAATRLRLVQDHINDPQKCRVLDNMSDWNSPQVTTLLTTKKNGQHTSYISRDMELKAHKADQGLLIGYND